MTKKMTKQRLMVCAVTLKIRVSAVQGNDQFAHDLFCHFTIPRNYDYFAK